MLKEILLYIQAYSNADVTNISSEFICETRDVFRARSERWFNNLIPYVGINNAAMLLSIVGEVGNNCYDHNLGRWQNTPGLCFFYTLGIVLIFDNGQGVHSSLSSAGHVFQDEDEFLNVALTKRITGRVGENRGNGLKLVIKYVNELGIDFSIQTGSARFYTTEFDKNTLKTLLLITKNSGVITILDFRKLLK